MATNQRPSGAGSRVCTAGTAGNSHRAKPAPTFAAPPGGGEGDGAAGSPAELAFVAECAVRGLQQLHAAGLVHCDVRASQLVRVDDHGRSRPMHQPGQNFRAPLSGSIPFL